MAARRLVVVMLVLLFVLSLVAALAPVQPVVEEPEEDPVTQVPPPAITQDPKQVEAQIDANAKEPPAIAVDVGDQLRLEVVSRTPATVELVGLGPTDDVDRFDPAVFDVLLTEKGTYSVRFLGRREPIGTIEATEPAPAPPARPSR